MIHHRRVNPAIQAVPPNKIERCRGIRAPWVALQEFLPHEKLGYSRRGQQESGGKTRAAASVPGARVRTIRQSWNARIAPCLNQIMVLYAGDRLPPMREALGIEIARDGAEINRCALAL